VKCLKPRLVICEKTVEIAARSYHYPSNFVVNHIHNTRQVAPVSEGLSNERFRYWKRSKTNCSLCLSKNVKLGIVLPQTTTMLILVQLLAEFYLTGKTEGIDILGLKPQTEGQKAKPFGGLF
jgi:hypothetical protein